MRPARKPAASPKKRNHSPDSDDDSDEDLTETGEDVAETDEDVTETVTPDAPSSFLKEIWAAQSKKKKGSYTGAGRIKDILQVHKLYDIVDIKEIKTRHGPRQVWSVKCLKDLRLRRFSAA